MPLNPTALAFDTTAELLWLGTDQVGFSSSLSPHMKKVNHRKRKRKKEKLRPCTYVHPSIQGYIQSFNGCELRRYTSYRGHNSPIPAERPVRQLLLNERGVISLASKSLHLSLRGGPSQWNLESVVIFAAF